MHFEHCQGLDQNEIKMSLELQLEFYLVKTRKYPILGYALGAASSMCNSALPCPEHHWWMYNAPLYLAQHCISQNSGPINVIKTLKCDVLTYV